MKKHLLWLLLPVLLVVIAATVVTPGLKVSEYPHTNNPPDSSLILLAVTNISPKTNMNTSVLEILQKGTNGLATTNFVNTIVTDTSNSITANSFAKLEVQTNTVRLGLVTNINWTYGMTGSVSSATAILGVDDSVALSNLSNNLSTTITVTSNFLATSSIDVKTNQTMMVLQQTPFSGSQWFVGSNSVPNTNQARAGFEVNAFFRSLRHGEVDGDIDPIGWVGSAQGSNAWNNTNLGVCTVGFGSNAYVKGAFSSVLGGAYNSIQTNAKYSVIAGGYNNLISTNSGTSTIGGGGRNLIRTDQVNPPITGNATIAGGSNNVISASTAGLIQWNTIGGGGDNLLQGARESTIAGGFANQIFEGCAFSVIGGGNQNRISGDGGSTLINGSTISGGQQNQTHGQYGFVGGGRENNQRGDATGKGSDYNVICGGASNDIGIANFPSSFCFVGGGHECDIANFSHYCVIDGGANNSISDNCTNSVIVGGRFNTISSSAQFGQILGGERNAVNAKYGVAIGTSNTVSAAYGVAIGTGVSVSSSGQTVIGNASSFFTSVTISGAGTGNTNYTLQAINQKMNLGSSNVNIVAVMQTTAGQSQRWRVAITNDSPDTWGFSASSTTNRWFWQSYMYGTNAPVVLTNNTRLVIDGESEGTNTWAEYVYYTPAK